MSGCGCGAQCQKERTPSRRHQTGEMSLTLHAASLSSRNIVLMAKTLSLRRRTTLCLRVQAAAPAADKLQCVSPLHMKA